MMCTLNLSAEDVNIVLEALGELPAKKVLTLIHNIHKQIENQKPKK